jgi:hypothetical protein
MTTPAQSRRYAYLANNLNKEDFNAYYAHLLEGGRVEDFFDKMEKHGTHDQKTHGNWATGSEVVTDLVAWRDSEIAKLGSDKAA